MCVYVGGGVREGMCLSVCVHICVAKEDYCCKDLISYNTCTHVIRL